MKEYFKLCGDFQPNRDGEIHLETIDKKGFLMFLLDLMFFKVSIASRCVLRVLPGVMDYREEVRRGCFQPVME